MAAESSAPLLDRDRLDSSYTDGERGPGDRPVRAPRPTKFVCPACKHVNSVAGAPARASGREAAAVCVVCHVALHSPRMRPPAHSVTQCWGRSCAVSLYVHGGLCVRAADISLDAALAGVAEHLQGLLDFGALTVRVCVCVCVCEREIACACV